ncbi:MAG: ATP-binding cassette domain-containing protein [Cyanothece sp. SIO1E1]|nr:ATP-binding cassette domain-containing protein [Cyanothece sp. SIO1E1]
MTEDLSTNELPQLCLNQVGLAATVGSGYVLQDLSFEVFSGDFMALVGASGAGKTSLLRLLNRLSTPTQGAIYLNQQDIRQIPTVQLRQQITLVPQEPKLLGMTVEQAIIYPLQLRRLSQKQIRQRLTEGLEHLQIPSQWLAKTELELSVGQRQRVAMARALVIQPQILLLDEPTSALDAGQSHHLLKVLTRFTQRYPITILMANHQLDLAQEFSNRMLHLQQGVLIADALTHQTDWVALKAALIELERQQTQEWE